MLNWLIKQMYYTLNKTVLGIDIEVKVQIHGMITLPTIA